MPPGEPRPSRPDEPGPEDAELDGPGPDGGSRDAPVPGCAEPHPLAAGPPRRTRLLAITAATLVVADLVTKTVAVHALTGRSVKLLGGLVYLTQARNSGAAFSFAEGATVLFTAVAVAVIAVIVRTASRLRSIPWAVCLGLILGGAAGNLVDRLFRAPSPLRGAVVDWISLLDPYGRVWPIFNLADSGIVCGGILAVILASLGYELDGRRGGREAPGADSADQGPAGDQPGEESGR